MTKDEEEIELRKSIGEIQDRWKSHANPCNHLLDDLIPLIHSYTEKLVREAKNEARKHMPDSLERVIKASRRTVSKETIEMFIFDARKLSQETK